MLRSPVGRCQERLAPRRRKLESALLTCGGRFLYKTKTRTRALIRRTRFSLRRERPCRPAWTPSPPPLRQRRASGPLPCGRPPCEGLRRHAGVAVVLVRPAGGRGPLHRRRERVREV